MRFGELHSLFYRLKILLSNRVRDDRTTGRIDALLGAPDVKPLQRFREIFEANNPLACTEIDDLINPQSPALHPLDSVGSAEEAQIDVTRSATDDYNIHTL